VNHMDPTLFQQPLLQRQQALAWAKALVWATSNGARECAPAVHDDAVGEMVDTTQS